MSRMSGALPPFPGVDVVPVDESSFADVSVSAGTDTGFKSATRLAGADTSEAAVDAHLIILVNIAALFAWSTNSRFPVNSVNTVSSAS